MDDRELGWLVPFSESVPEDEIVLGGVLGGIEFVTTRRPTSYLDQPSQPSQPRILTDLQSKLIEILTAIVVEVEPGHNGLQFDGLIGEAGDLLATIPEADYVPGETSFARFHRLMATQSEPTEDQAGETVAPTTGAVAGATGAVEAAPGATGS